LPTFFGLVLPSLVNWLVPAVLLSMAIRGRPAELDKAEQDLQLGALVVLALFLLTIALTVAVHTFLDLPPALRMMAGLGLLKGYSYLFNRGHQRSVMDELDDVFAEPQLDPSAALDDESPVLTGWQPAATAITVRRSCDRARITA
jgi:hypothetical protein